MKIHKYLKYILYWFTLGLLASLIGHLIIEGLQRIGFTNALPHVQLLLVGTGILFILYTLLSALLGSSILGGSTLVITAIIIGSINRAKIHYRADPLFPNDFIIAKEVPFLVEMIGWLYSFLIVFAIVLGVVIVVRFYQKRLKPKKKELPKKLEWISRIIGVLVSGFALIYLNQFHKPEHALRTFYFDQADWTFDHQLSDYQNNGFIAGFLANIQGEPMDEPSGYSRDRVTEIYEKYSKLSNEVNLNKGEQAIDTNIIFVMNESFSDPFNLEGITSDKDPLNHFRKIASETLNGQVISPTFGGGTNANEFQALTGFSLEPLNPQITSPYMQLDEKVETYPSIVHKLNDLNYRTTAIHPYDKNFFKREQVYEKMGFDLFLHEDNMANKEKISENHLFISDESTYKEAFDVLNESKETDFIHVVTMQNHTPYADKYEEVEYRVSGSGNAHEAEGYFQDLENSDKALKELIDQIDAQQEPILLIFWGDHLPGLYRGEIRETNDDFTFRKAPFLVYSNTIELEGGVATTSPIYFNNWIYEWLSIELTAYDALLLKLEEVLPMIDDGLYLENGELLTSRKELSPEALEVLKEYSLIMYDITTGEQYSHDHEFFE